MVHSYSTLHECPLDLEYSVCLCCLRVCVCVYAVVRVCLFVCGLSVMGSAAWLPVFCVVCCCVWQLAGGLWAWLPLRSMGFKLQPHGIAVSLFSSWAIHLWEPRQREEGGGQKYATTQVHASTLKNALVGHEIWVCELRW